MSTHAFASPAETARQANVEEDVLGIEKQTPVPVGADAAAESTNSENVSEKPSVFNGISVPPMKELRGETFDKEVKDGYWYESLNKCYRQMALPSPMMRPERTTSNPLPSTSKSAETKESLNSFQRYYDFHFASLDCTAWGDACTDHKIDSFPTFVLYKTGEEVKRFTGTRDLEWISRFIEEQLESIRPGSRPKDGVKLPKVGKDHSEADTVKDVPQGKSKDTVVGELAKQEQVETTTATAAVTATTSSQVALQATSASKQKEPPNPIGTSIALTQESFQKLVTTTQDPWFIKFYAPWCHHCQALAPNWQQMARELRGKLNVGEVNCDAEARLCKDVRVKGYPTIHFFRGGERVEYDGLRGLGDLLSYAKKALDIGSGVTYVDAAGFKALEETEEVIFVYFYDQATTSEDFEALERLTLSLIGHAKLVKTDSAVLADRFKIHTWPRLLVSRDGRPSYYTALAPKDMRDFRRVLSWMKTVWLPILPELTASNSLEIMSGKLVVLGILSRERSDDFVRSKREIKSAALEWMDKETHAFQLERQEMRDAKQLRIEEAEDRNDQRALRAAKGIRIQIEESDRTQVGFAWVDGIFWERWIRTTYGIEVKQGERVIINDEDHKKYWDITSSGAPIVPSRTSILETLPKVVADPPKIAPKYTTGKIEQVFFQARGASKSHPWVSIGLFVGVLIGVAIWGKGRIRRTKGGSGGGFFQLDGKEGLLNGGGTGKVD
ncbi:MAG: hypothetical protein Q9187_005264 [Circinaria calcarea]